MPAITATDRLHFIDHLRWIVICLVVMQHAAVTYSNFGRWYYMAPPPHDVGTLVFFAVWQSFTQAWSMGFLFLIAGYFAAGSFDRKGGKRFLADRALRLGVPALLYIFLIQPFIVYVLIPLQSAGARPPFGRGWLRYVTSLRFLGGTGPLWFAVALLIFCAIYAAIRMLRANPPRLEVDAPPPRNRDVILLILAISICTFLVRIVQPQGTAVLNMQLCYFSQYILLFAVGIQAYRKDWLLRIPYGFGCRWFGLALAGGSVLWAVLIVAGGAITTRNLAPYDGGLHWQSAGLSFWESFFSVGTCLGLTVILRERANGQGRLTKFLSDNSFAVYVFHPPIVIGVAMLLRDLEAPAVVKFAVTGGSSIVISFVASEFLWRRIPLLKRAL